MTTKQIDYCIELSRTLNFSRAADNLFVSQPTFSYQIRLLEEEIGFAVFERSGKGADTATAFLSACRYDSRSSSFRRPCACARKQCPMSRSFPSSGTEAVWKLS